MITFLDENDAEYGALATIKATNAVNGERSLTGTIASGDYVLSNIERGWRLRFDDEYFVVTYAKPIDEGRDVQVEFDAVHQFFWDFDKSSVYDQLTDGSHTFVAYLDFIFKNSGYSYTVDTALNVHAFEKQSFGFKKRLTLFNDIITSTGVEFQINGKVVRILEKVGTDLSTVVRKNFNMNELTIEKNIGDFVTYQKGFGAYFDEEDHSKGRLEVEYTSPLASVYGRLEAGPFVDERYSQSSSLLAALKENVDNSYSISVSLDIEDLTRAGYRYTQPVAGDYIMAINETLGFKEKIRIVSFTSEYDVAGQLIKHTVTCNDIGSVKKLSASYTHTQHQAANAEANANTAYEFANKALISADGKNTNYYGDSFPVDNPKGTLKKGDLLFLTVGDKVKQYYWNGADWVINPVLDDVEAFKEQIADELKDVPNREEFENKIAEEVANSKAEIETQIETAKTQAESNAKEYADTINQETAKVAEQANAAADEIKADLVNVKNNLTATSLVANNAQAAVDATKQELTEVANELSTAKQDLADSVTAVNTKVDNAKAELTQTKQELTEVANELNTAKQDLADSVAEVNTKVDGAKAELTQTKQQLTNVAGDLSQAKTDLQNAVSEVDTKAANLQSDLSQAKQDLASQAQQLQTQANAQTELSKRVTTVETTANGTKTTVNELTKTVAQNGKDITSVTNRTKTVEDDLANTKTTLTQVQTTANSTSQKTAILETGLDGLNAKFDNLKIGGRNLLSKTNQGKTNWSWRVSSGGTTAEDYNVDGVKAVKLTRTSDSSASWDYIQYNGLIRNLIEPNTKYTLSFDVKPSVDVTFWASLKRGDGGSKLTNDVTMNKATANRWTKVSCVLTSITTLPDDLSQVVYLSGMPTANGNWLIIKNIKLEKGNVATDYSPSEVDFEQKVAEYKQTADQNYASLSSTVQTLDGQVQSNKTTAEQTAQGFKTRIESLETYKNGESERANAYFESAKTETAKQLTAERTAIAKDYVAKSTYTSDVSGIRNELSATTSTANATKTNLANYQARNDKMVASLKSSLQTTDGNVSNLQTKVEAVPGQITSAVSAVEGKIPTNIGTVNLIKRSTAQKGLRLAAGAGTLSDSKHELSDWIKIEPSTIYTLTTYEDVNEPNMYYSLAWYSTNNADYSGWIDRPTGTALAADLKGGRQYTSPANAAYAKVSYPIKYPKVKLERGNISTDYSSNPEDYDDAITQVKSEIKQTADGMTLLVTKTELNTAKNELQSGINTANNKANAAQSTANNNAQTISTHTTQISALNTGLQAKVSQSDFNTLSGRVTTAENNITAKANELSSKITSVEGKIPTNVSTRNLILKSNDLANPHKQSGANTTVTSTNGYFVVKSTGYTDNAWGGISWNMSISEVKAGEQFSILMPVYIDSSVPLDNGWAFALKNHKLNSLAYSYDIPTNKKDQWFNVAITFKASKDVILDTYPFYVFIVKNGLVRIKPPMLVRGNLIPSDYQPAFDDTESDINAVSSELKQTADGMTLLATKTELNTAKNELQSGINTATNKANAAQNTADGAVTKANSAQSTANNNAQTISTHTTQISALNTGLQAKVSQTDFNTLSGRVTTAENNITAKANELSSKITSVEGKIPTEIGAKNLIVKSTAKIGFRLSAVGEPFADNSHMLTDWIKIEPSTVYTLTTYEDVNEANMYYSLAWYSTNNADYSGFISRPTGTASAANLKGGKQYQAPDNAKYAKVSYPTKYDKFKLERGKISTDYTPAPEDTAEQISSLSSEIKQTADGMTLLATKTELNTAKNELQSGINTATNKANAAQSTANNNAQTISTHTTQISALNTGLQAKVSQTDFNTLSGRVTTAENNIVAKANELSSKITSVEGKIPTSSGGRNLAQGTSKDWSKPFTRFSGIENTGVGLYQVLTDGLSVGDKLKTRIVLKYTGIVPTSGKTAKIRMQGSGNVTEWGSGGYNFSTWKTISGSGEVVIEHEFTIEADHLKNDYWNMGFRTDWIASGSLQWKLAKVERGMFFTDWSPAPEDTAEQISSLSSELKQTTDAIKASVTSLDNSTVKSSSLTINADGIVMKAGKSTTDVANAIGSYFAVNQNAINLFSDKINVKGNMIVNGAITSDKIASKQINTSHLNGKIITADVISSNAVTANAIKAGAVTTDKMSANSINGDRITAGTLDAAKIKAGSITASQIASGTITSNQIKAGGISSANIAAGAITGDKIAAGAIDANKIAANAITANMIKGGQLNSTNGATVFDLNAGTLTFNNDRGYIQRVAGDKIFEITTYLGKSLGNSQEYLTSDFTIRKSDNSRRSGIQFQLYSMVDNQPTATAKINADSLNLYNSQNTKLFSINGSATWLGNFNIQGWGDIPVAQVYGGLLVKDIAIGGHTKSLLKIVEELCKKAGILWV